MALADFIVIKVVRWGSFNAACTKIFINVSIANNGDTASNQWQFNKLAD